MTNPLRVANKSKLIEEKTKRLFNDLKVEYDKGLIKTQTELAYRIYIALEDMFTQLGKPTMHKRYALGPPVSAYYNDMMTEIYNDIKNLFSESASLTAALQESFQQVEIERQGINWQTKKLNDRLNTIGLLLAQETSEVIFRDSFLDATKMDNAMIKDDVATINTNEGVLSLLEIEAEDYNSNLTVSILEGNGFLGNTHQVRALNGTYKFYGEDDLNIDLLNMIDDNSDTWVEYEAFSLPQETRTETLGFGFDYKEGMTYVVDETDKLHMSIQIDLSIAKTINWLTVAPFVPTDKGSTPSIITSILIEDGKGASNEISGGYDLLREDQVYTFSRQSCKRIIIKIEQPTSYETLIGHIFYKQLDSASNSYMSKDRELEGNRIDGDKISIETLGYQYDPATRSIVQPTRTQEVSDAYDEDGMKATLFQVPDVTGQAQAGLEAVLAKRFFIGLKDITISSYRFSSSSEYVSTCYESEDEIVSVELDTVEQVPEEFGEGEWLSYAITIDNGKTWNTIYPRGTAKDGAKIKYIINQNVPEEGRYDNYGYLDTEKPVKNVRVRILLKRPTSFQNSDYYTPLVKEYKLHCKTKKGE